MKLNGNIEINKDGTNTVTIRIEDELSSSQFVEVRMIPTDFAEALFGRGHVPCSFELRPELVGKKRQHKTEIVFVPNHDYKDMVPVRKAVSEFEIDGWHGRDEDATNHYNKITHLPSAESDLEMILSLRSYT